MLHIVTKLRPRILILWLDPVLNLCLVAFTVWHIVVKGDSPSKPYDLYEENTKDKDR